MVNLAPFLSYVFVTSFTPGPNNIMSMTNANRDGFKKTVVFDFGVSAGFLVIMLTCSYFNLVLFSIIPRIKPIMSIVGFLYMFYLAYKIYTSNSIEGKGSNTHINSFFAGLMMQFINPKAILYGLTVASNFIIPYYNTHAAIILFSLFLAFIALVSTICWAMFGSLFQKFLSRYMKAFNTVMSLLLIYSAIALFR